MPEWTFWESSGYLVQSKEQVTIPPAPLNNKGVQILEVAAEESSGRITYNNDFSDLCLGMSEMPAADSVAPYILKQSLLLCDLGIVPGTASGPGSPVPLLILWVIQSDVWT